MTKSSLPRLSLPKFSANLGFLWPDRPLLDRIAAAAKAGFKAVELHWPYDMPAEEVRGACQTGRAAARSQHAGRQCRGGRFRARRAGGPAGGFRAGPLPRRPPMRAPPAPLPCMSWRASCRATSSGQDRFSPPTCGPPRPCAPDLTLLLEPINQRDKPGYFYSTHRRSGGADRGGRRAESEDHVRRLSCRRQRGRHPDQAAAPHAASSAMSRSPRCRAAPNPTRARSPMARCSPRSTGSAMPAGSAANTSRAPAPTKACAGPHRSAFRCNSSNDFSWTASGDVWRRGRGGGKGPGLAGLPPFVPVSEKSGQERTRRAGHQCAFSRACARTSDGARPYRRRNR